MNDYAKRKPRKKGCLLAFRALLEAASWRRAKDVEEGFSSVVTLTLPDRVAFDFPDDDLRVEMRVNYAFGLARISSVGRSASKNGRHT